MLRRAKVFALAMIVFILEEYADKDVNVKSIVTEAADLDDTKRH